MTGDSCRNLASSASTRWRRRDAIAASEGGPFAVCETRRGDDAVTSRFVLAAGARVIDGRRWSVPGDLASLAAGGSLVFQGRGSRVINTGGEKVYAEEVENVVLTHPAVRDAIVVGVPDQRWGSRIAVVAALAPGASLDLPELRELVGRQLAGYKRPRDLIIRPELRRTPAGKADLGWPARSPSARRIVLGTRLAADPAPLHGSSL